MHKYPKECQGCSITRTVPIPRSNDSCCVSSFSLLKKIYTRCPCLKCLIKPICDEPCNDFFNFIKKNDPQAEKDGYEFPDNLDK